MMMDAPRAVGEDKEKESDDEKHERKREQAVRQAMYALTSAVELQAIDPEYLSDPKVQGIISQIHATLPAASTPEIAPEAEPEEELEPDMGGPMDESMARKRVGTMFGMKE